MNRTTLASGGLFAIQIVASVAGLVTAKYWLPRLHLAWESGSGLLYPGSMVIAGGGLYALSFCLWLIVLARIELSVAYPIYVGATMLLTACSAVLLFNEPMTAVKITGMLLVCAGVVCLIVK